MAKFTNDNITFDQMKHLEANNLEICDHCNGYGSSLKDPIGVDRCTVCGGKGVRKKEEQDAKKVEAKEKIVHSVQSVQNGRRR